MPLLPSISTPLHCTSTLSGWRETRERFKSLVKRCLASFSQFSLQACFERDPNHLFVNVFSGISGIRLLLENPREYALDQKTFLLFSSRTRTYYNYTNGCKVIMGGSLRVTFSHHLKVLLWEYEVQKYEEFLPRSIILHACTTDGFSQTFIV